MKTVRGHYNGSVVVLDEPAPVDHEVEVTVGFPDARTSESNGNAKREKRFHWDETRKIMEGCDVDSTDIIRRMRDMD
jgi:hypothetical protein